MVPSLPGVYVPPGLRKLNLVEMKKWGSSHNISKLEMVDHLGNPMPSDSFMITNRKLLMHMYANDSGRVVLAVVIEMSDALKKELLEGKW
ncbi:MAG: hypothetical protein IPH93_06760 [Saprospiraceae bacterium]|nr:hypothetical protein [Saprospiraceae bacterium]